MRTPRRSRRTPDHAPRRAGVCEDDGWRVQGVFGAGGANAAGRMSDEDLKEIEENACPGAGACGGQFTANTMAMALEFLGLSPFGSSSPPALDGRKDEACVEAGRLVMRPLEGGLPPTAHRH